MASLLRHIETTAAIIVAIIVDWSLSVLNIDLFCSFLRRMKVANILLNGVRYESDLGENAQAQSQMSMKLLCVAIYRMPPSLRSLCTNHFLGRNHPSRSYFKWFLPIQTPPPFSTTFKGSCITSTWKLSIVCFRLAVLRRHAAVLH